MARRLRVPLDVVLIVLEYVDQNELYSLGLTSKFVSPHALQQLWNMPYINNTESLQNLCNTLSISSSARHPYKDWISGLAIHLEMDEDNNYNYQAIADEVFTTLSQVGLEILSLQHIHIANSRYFEEFLSSQLKQGIAELYVYQCTSATVIAVLNSIQTQDYNPQHLSKLCFYDCSLTDSQVEKVAQYCPNLQTLKLDRCGCLSDSSMIAIAKNCKQLDTLLVTLPSNIIQSNTITLKTIEALEEHCLSLKQFVCGGQVRISEYITSRQHLDKHFNDAIVSESLPLPSWV